MQIGPVRFSFNEGTQNGIWLSKSGGPEQNITIPVVVGVVVALFVFCCCARALF